MKYIFCSSVFNMEDYQHLSEKSKVPLSLADHNLNRNLILGLDEATGTPVTLVNNTPIPNYPNYPKIIFKKKSWQHTEGGCDIHCGFINLPLIKHLSRAITTYRGIKKAVKAAGDEPVLLLTYDLHLGACLAIRRAKRAFPNLRTFLFMPDVPNVVLQASTGGNVTRSSKVRAGIKMKFISQFDSYGFIAAALADVVDTTNKPYTVIEGIYNNHQPPLAAPTTDKKIIFYSGQLNPAYGMENLLEAFVKLYPEHPDHELWLCGSGRLSERIKELEKQCPGIRYYGYVDGNRVRQLQAEATVLINPRQNTDAFTKFSFPSKTMEYLASGKPVIGYKLDGIPAEYDPYIQYVADNSIEALQDKLLEICSLPECERHAIGHRSRAFILENKNPKAMCRRITALWEQPERSDGQ